MCVGVCVRWQVFIIACLFGELWMSGILGILLFLVCYLALGRPSSSPSTAAVNTSNSTGQYSFELENAVSVLITLSVVGVAVIAIVSTCSLISLTWRTLFKTAL